MKLPRRKFLNLTAGGMASAAVSRFAWALDYPTRPVRIVVGYPAGSSSDIVARLMAQWLSERLGQQFIVENRSGAGTNIATEAVVRAAPDGYTLLFVTQTNAINATLYDKLEFDFIRDIAPIAGIVRVAGVMVVNPSSPAKTVSEFIAYAKSNPGKINMGSGGNGSAQHLYGELFMMMTGVAMVHVPYRGQPLNDLVSGQLQVVFGPIPSAIGFVRAGTVRALAVTTATRLAALPDIPSVAESVPGYEASGWFGLGAPINTPPPIVNALNKEVNAALADATVKTRLADLGGDPMPMTAAAFGKLIVDETAKWGKVIRNANIKPE
jgi:tripartite-type tricarboxylate transporter receptor subunit TctC